MIFFKSLAIFFLSLVMSCQSYDFKNLRPVNHVDKKHFRSYDYFFLPSLPLWANFCSEFQCRRSEIIEYLDFKKVMDEYNWDYKQVALLQAIFHHMKKNQNDWQQAYYSAYEKVVAGVLPWPEFNKETPLFFIQWDKLKGGSDDKKEKIVKLIKDNELDRYPLFFVSLCLTSHQLETEIKAMNLGEDFWAIGAEYSSVFNKTGNQTYEWDVSLQGLFSDHKKMTVFFKFY